MVENASLAGAFAIGFTIGVITCLRLIGTTFNASERIIRRHIKQEIVKERIDHPSTDALDKSE
jgi:hypothetical protein